MSGIKELEKEKALEKAVRFCGVPKSVQDSPNGPIGLYEVEKNVFRIFLVDDINRKKRELNIATKGPSDLGWFREEKPAEKE